MTKQQNNKRAMLESVVSLIETNAARTSSIPGITESVTRFKNLMDEMTSKTVEVKQSDPLEVEIRSFLRSAINRTEPQVSGREGRRCLELAVRILESMTMAKGVSP